MNILKPRTLIVTPHSPELLKQIDVYELVDSERKNGFLTIVLEESIECNENITPEQIASVVPFMVDHVDRVVIHWTTETEIYEAVIEHCHQTEKEVERV